MADAKLSALTELAETPNDADLLHVVDVSDTTMAATGTNKKITVANALASKQDVITGLTASGAELNILDGATLTTTELNYVDGVTSSIQTQLDTKAEALDDLSDVVITTPANGEVLKYNGTNWVNGTDSTGAGGSMALGDVTDVTITTVADNEVLAYDNVTSEWINQTAAEAGLAAASHSHAPTDITGLTASAAELNILDGATLTTTELNYVDGVTSAIQTQLDTKGDVTAASTHTFTNKTIDANGTGNSISNLEVADFAAAAVVTAADTIAANDNDTTLPTSAAVIDYVAANAGGGTLDGLSDVVITTPADGQVLTYDSATSEWKNENSASGFSNPMTTEGDIIYGGASGAATRLAKGTAGQVLTMNAGATAPEWAAASGGGGSVDLTKLRHFSWNAKNDSELVTTAASATVSTDTGLIVTTTIDSGSRAQMTSRLSGWPTTGFFDHTIVANILLRTAAPRTHEYSLAFGGLGYSAAGNYKLMAIQNRSGNIVLRTGDGTASTDTDLSASIPTTFSIKEVQLVHTPATNQKCYVNGSLVATNTTNIPSGDGYAGGIFQFHHSSGSTGVGGTSRLGTVEMWEQWS